MNIISLITKNDCLSNSLPQLTIMETSAHRIIAGIEINFIDMEQIFAPSHKA